MSDGASVGDVTCGFVGIISPNDAIVSMQILGYDCVSTYDPTSFGDTVVTEDTDPASGATSFNAVANVDLSSGHEGEVAFCIHTDLEDATASSEIMIFRSEQIKVNFTYDGSFSVEGFSNTPYEGIGLLQTNARKNFGVTATVCDSLGATLSFPPPLSVGTNLFVCFETNVVGTIIPAFDSFTAQKGTGIPYDVSVPSSTVVIRGLGSSNVKVVMNLPARFFADATVLNLSGSVVVRRDSRRHLESSRALVSNSENAEFRLVVEVNVDNSSASGCVIMMSTAIFTVAALLFL